MKTVFPLLSLCIILLCSCHFKVDPSLVAPPYPIRPSGVTEEKRTSNEMSSYYVHRRIDSSFTVRDSVHKSTRIEYPDYMGGIYLNPCGKLVVVAKGDTTLVRKELEKRCGNSDFIMQQGEFSYNELVRINSMISDFTMARSKRPEITSTGIRTSINRVVVSFKDLNFKNIFYFKLRVTTSRAVLFEEGDYTILDVKKVETKRVHGETGFHPTREAFPDKEKAVLSCL